MKHTPGPWKVSTSPDYFEGGATVIRENNRRVVAVVTKAPDGITEANARLITHAPEMLAFIQRRTFECTDCSEELGLECPACNYAKALINKIEDTEGE